MLKKCTALQDTTDVFSTVETSNCISTLLIRRYRPARKVGKSHEIMKSIECVQENIMIYLVFKICRTTCSYTFNISSFEILSSFLDFPILVALYASAFFRECLWVCHVHLSVACFSSSRPNRWDIGFSLSEYRQLLIDVRT